MHFDLTDIRVFVQVAEQGSITKGAAKVHLSPPAVSTRIKELEQQVGVRLLYRAPGGVALTPAGQVLLQHALILLSGVENLKSDMQLFHCGMKGHIRVFASTTAVSDFMPEVLIDFLVKHPNIDIDLQERLTPEIIRGVLDGTTDMGIISGPVNADGLDKHRFSTGRLVLVISPDHPLSAFDKINFVQATDYDFIGLPEYTNLQNFLNMLLQESNKRLLLRVQVNNFEAMCRMIEAGVALALSRNPLLSAINRP